MKVTVIKVGDDEGIIIPEEVLSRMGLKAGDMLQLSVVGDAIRLVPEQTDLLRQIKASRAAMDKYKVALRELAK